MVYFKHTFLTDVSAATAAIYRVKLLQEYKSTNVVNCIVTP